VRRNWAFLHLALLAWVRKCSQSHLPYYYFQNKQFFVLSFIARDRRVTKPRCDGDAAFRPYQRPPFPMPGLHMSRPGATFVPPAFSHKNGLGDFLLLMPCSCVRRFKQLESIRLAFLLVCGGLLDFFLIWTLKAGTSDSSIVFFPPSLPKQRSLALF